MTDLAAVEPTGRPVAGVRWSAAASGIRYAGRPDLALMALAPGTTVTAVFTRNRFRAAPVEVAERHLGSHEARFLLVNSGNANAGTGQDGLESALACCRLVGEAGGVAPEAVLPFSTGVIGEPLPLAPFAETIPRLIDDLAPEGWAAAARAIMTTDTVAKLRSTTIDLGGHPATVTGIAKGSGMIRPDMATMLAFLATDAPVSRETLHALLQQAVARSFNRITVDGDTSTNDACVLVATGQAGGKPVTSCEDPRAQALGQAVTAVSQSLAHAVIADGEGATKFVAVRVTGGRESAECLQVAYATAHSPLVKTALFASDPNWGRILAAVGRAGIDDLNVGAVSIHLDEICIVRNGGRAPEYTESQGQRIMARDRLTIQVNLARGDAEETVWTTDLSHEYIRINADYRS